MNEFVILFFLIFIVYRAASVVYFTLVCTITPQSSLYLIFDYMENQIRILLVRRNLPHKIYFDLIFDYLTETVCALGSYIKLQNTFPKH